METKLWMKHGWNDFNMRWKPSDYNGIISLRLPSDLIWLPDIVLYNNAVGDFQVEQKIKAIVKYDGNITWMPPAIFKSSCSIDVTYFPFDAQNCTMKFGSWTHDQSRIDLSMVGLQANRNESYWESGEWQIKGNGFNLVICALRRLPRHISHYFKIRITPYSSSLIDFHCFLSDFY